MPKVHTTVTLDIDTKQQAESLGLNISEVCDNALSMTVAKTLNPRVTQDEITVMQAFRKMSPVEARDTRSCLKENPSFAAGQVTRIFKRHGIEVKEEALLKYISKPVGIQTTPPSQ